MAKQLLGELVWKITGDNTDANKKLKETEKNAKGFSDKLSTAFKTIGFVAVAAGITKISKALINAASDAEEAQNAVNVTFKEGAQLVNDYAKTASTSVGLSSNKFKELSTIVGAQLKQSGFAIEKVAEQTITLTERASDLASVFNVEVSEATNALGAALRGETEPARRFGINISQAAIEVEALATGLVNTKKEITEQIKVQARLSLIYKQSADVAGDFRNTSDGLANSTRILKGRFEDLKANLGTALLPVAASVVGAFNSLLDTEGDLDKVTNSLISSSKEYEEISKKLAEASGNLSDEEERRLRVRRALLGVDLIKRAKEFEASLNLQTIYTKQSRESADEYKAAISRLDRALAEADKNGEKRIKLQERDKRLLDIRNDGFGRLLRGTQSVAQASKRYADIQEELSAKEILAVKRQEAYNKSLDELSRALNAGSISQRLFNSLSEEAQAVIKTRAEALAKIDAAEKKRLANLDAEAKKLAALEALKKKNAEAEAKRLADEELKQQQKLDFYDQLAGKISAVGQVLSSFSSLSSALTTKRTEELDNELKTRLEDEKLTAKEKLALEEEFQKKKADAEYKGALVTWGLNLGEVIAQSAIAVIQAFPDPFLMAASGVAGLAATGAVLASKPQRASFDVGTMRVGSDQVADIHKNEIILPASLSEEARSEGITIAPKGGGTGNTIIQFVTNTKEVLYETMLSDSKNGVFLIDDLALVKG